VQGVFRPFFGKVSIWYVLSGADGCHLDFFDILISEMFCDFSFC